MAQNREHLEKLLQFLDSLIKVPGNEWFVEELAKRFPEYKRLEVTPNAKIDDIYEYCIENILRRQAIEFYKGFPLKSIIPTLVEDFVRMESFKRKDNFGDFCLALYQQIECITNRLCESKDLTYITEKLWGYPAYIKQERGKEPKIDNRLESEYTIAALVFPGQNKKTGMPYSLEKTRTTLQSQYANDKIRIIVYFLGYKCMMKSSDYDSYIEITSLLNDIYSCRNMNHRGNTLNDWESEAQNRILSVKSFYYYKFQGVLAQYIEFVKLGLEYLDEIKKYCDTLQVKKIDVAPKVIGKIDLPQDNKRRFKT